MKGIYLFIAVLSMHFVQASELQFQTSKVLGVYNFLETASGAMGTSQSLRAYIVEKASENEQIKDLASQFAGINLNYNYQWESLPRSRHSFRSTHDMILKAAALARDIDDFSDRIFGLLPVPDHNLLLELMRKTEPIYEEWIWNAHSDDIEKQRERMTAFGEPISKAFDKLRQFYNSEWSEGEAFKVVIYPIPGKGGHATASPHSNVLVVGVFTGEDDLESRAGVIVHEMCHVLYDSQGAQFQSALESWFDNSPSPYARLAKTYFDEGMATACGNGWAFKQLTGAVEKGSWYNNDYIDRFGHATYALVEEYLSEGRQLDKSFVDKAIALFEQEFPGAYLQLNAVLNNFNLYSDAVNADERKLHGNLLMDRFEVFGYSFSTPIDNPTSLQKLETDAGVHVLIIDRNVEGNTALLRNTFPELKTLEIKGSGILDFVDAKGRPVIAIIGLDKAQLKEAINLLENMGRITEEPSFSSLK